MPQGAGLESSHSKSTEGWVRYSPAPPLNCHKSEGALDKFFHLCALIFGFLQEREMGRVGTVSERTLKKVFDGSPSGLAVNPAHVVLRLTRCVSLDRDENAFRSLLQYRWTRTGWLGLSQEYIF